MGTLGPGDIHHALTQGPGTSSFQLAKQASSSLAASHQERESQAMALVMKMGSVWTGDASEAAQAGAAPLLRAFRDGQQALTTHQDLMGRQTDSFGVARTSVHDVPNQPPSASFGDMLSDVSGASLFTGGGYLNKVQDWSEKANANVAAYSGYANASSYNRSNMPNEYGDPSGSSSDVSLATAQPGPGGPGPGGTGVVNGPGGTGGPNAPVSHYSGGPGSSQSMPNGTGTGGGPSQGTGGYGSGGGPSQGTGGYGPGSTTTQGWPGGPTAPGTGGGWPTPGGAGTGLGTGDGGGFQSGTPFAAGGFGAGVGVGGNGSAGGSGGARGMRAGGMTGAGGSAAAAEKVAGPGARAGAGMPGGSGTAVAAGRPGATGAQGAGGMAGGAQGGRKEEDKEHKSAAYLEDDYSDELIGELPRTTPTVIGLD
jgi:hypothetical protein